MSNKPDDYEEHVASKGPMPSPPRSAIEQALIDDGAPASLTIKEAAKFAKVSYGYMARMVRDNMVVAYKPGRAYMITRESLADFISARQANKLEDQDAE